MPDVPAPTGSVIVFDRPRACAIAGIKPADLTEWEAELGIEAGADRAGFLTLADVIGLCALGEMAQRLGPHLRDFRQGVIALMQLLSAAPEPERLGDHTALVDRDFAWLTETHAGHVGGADGAIIAIPIAPLLAALRDQVFP